MKVLALAGVVLVLAACGDDSGIAGVWSGTSTLGTALSVTIVETQDGVVSGSGTMGFGTLILPVNITGAHAHPALSLTIDVSRLNVAPVSFQGRFRADMGSVRGALNNQSVSGDSLVLNRVATAPAARMLAP